MTDAILKPSELAKQFGLPSLKAVSEATGINVQTLIEWHKNRPQLFVVILTGCAAQERGPMIPITVSQCGCGDDKCPLYQLRGIGRWTHGSGFDHDDAHTIAALLNQYRAARRG